MEYLTILEEAEDEFEVKKSIFIGYINRVSCEEEAIQFINNIKTKNKDARHNVYAYVIGQNKEIQRYSDDGEPKGTAGIPILEILKRKNLTDVVVVVTRYFGGVLLGTGGLARAYSKGATIAIAAAGIVEKVIGVKCEVICTYEFLGKIQYICDINKWYIEDILYEDNVKISLFLVKEDIDIFENEINRITSAKANINVEKEKYYFKKENRLYLECNI
ncbi:YigZ family protein [Clostridium sp. DL1XJH146]